MFWRDRPDVVDSWYEKLDALIGRVEEQIARRGFKRLQLLIVSDHGFADFDHKVHLNRWLIDKGYLNTHVQKNDVQGESNSLQAVDWQTSVAYALGLRTASI
jgi:predicted AlkP superfamily phosphohydrolase/phosphomutase